MAAVVVIPGGQEAAVISDGHRRIRIDVEHGTLLRGPVHLTFVIEGVTGIDTKILTLRRLAALSRLGRFARGLYPRERFAPRWTMALRAHDAMRDGASQREFAMRLFDSPDTAVDWNEASNFRRLRVQRLVRMGRSMVQGGYRVLLC
jgi:hypothetical protein